MANAFCIFFILNQLFLCFSSLIFAFFVSRNFDESLHSLLQTLETRKIQNQGNYKNGSKRPFIYDVGKKYQKVWTPFPTSTTIRFWFDSKKQVDNNYGSHAYKKTDITWRVFPYSWIFFCHQNYSKVFFFMFSHMAEVYTEWDTLFLCNFENKFEQFRK